MHEFARKLLISCGRRTKILFSQLNFLNDNLTLATKLSKRYVALSEWVDVEWSQFLQEPEPHSYFVILLIFNLVESDSKITILFTFLGDLIFIIFFFKSC